MTQRHTLVLGVLVGLGFSACGDSTSEADSPTPLGSSNGTATPTMGAPAATTPGGDSSPGPASVVGGMAGASGANASGTGGTNALEPVASGSGGEPGGTVNTGGGGGSSVGGSNPSGTMGGDGGAASFGAGAAGGASGTGVGGLGGSNTGGVAGTNGGSGGHDDGAAGMTNSSGSGGAGSPDACAPSQVAADEVLIIGDSYFPAAGSAIVVELRRLAGAEYRDRSVPGAKMDAIINQYDTAPAPQPKVVIMDGGGNDVLQNGGCSPGCAEHEAAVTQARDFFARVQMEGVQDIVFLFYYDMPLIKDGLDWMRPELRAECEQSPVPCHFVDVQPLFAGTDASTYTTDGIHPTAEAGRTIAGAIWSVMQEDCVAQ